MIINDKRETKTIRFDCVKIGEVFFDLAETEEFMMKTADINNYSDDHYNAVNLETGEYYYFSDNELVEKIKAVLTISY